VRARLAALGCGLWAWGAVVGNSELCAQGRVPSAESRLQVFHVTIGQGALYWEKYGHNMLLFQDASRGIDLAFNWGSFDFAGPDFLERQIIGDPVYWVDAYPGTEIIQAYARTNRTITAQRLNLTPEQAERAYAFASRNALPEHKHYRYDYYRDNCSTRVRDAIDHALGGALQRATGARVKLTYRGETLRLLDDLKLAQFGTHVALGQPADRLLTVWESMFIPMRLRDAIRLVRVPGADGREVPLVAEERVLYESPTHRDRDSVPTLWIPYLIVGLVLGLEFLAVGGVGRRARVADVIFRVEAVVFAFLTGALGLALLLAWTITRHEFWYRNENLLLVNPLSLFLFALLVVAHWKPRLSRPAAILAVIVAALAVLALVLKLVPGFSQNNIALIALLLPAHAAIAWGLWQRRQPIAESRVPQ
jgi:hypothetical protein